jgi:elongation factor P
MANLNSTQLRKGVVFKDQNRAYIVLDYKHVKKGRGLAHIRVKVRDLEGGATLEKTYSSNEKVESVDITRTTAQYLYSDKEQSYFMDSKDYSQFGLKNAMIESERKFLREGIDVGVLWLEGKVVSIEIPKVVELKVKYTEPGVVGDTACGATKEAELESGFKLQVPLFIKIGDVIRVNTERYNYISKK